MAEENPKRDDIRTTVSLHPIINKWAEELMAERGYNNFSAMVADLIRQERDRQQREAAQDALSLNDKTAHAKQPKESPLKSYQKRPKRPPHKDGTTHEP